MKIYRKLSTYSTILLSSMLHLSVFQVIVLFLQPFDFTSLVYSHALCFQQKILQTNVPPRHQTADKQSATSW